MEGSFRNPLQEQRDRNQLFERIVRYYGMSGERAANMQVSTPTGNKRLKDISMRDGQELFNNKVRILIQFIGPNEIKNMNKENNNPNKVLSGVGNDNKIYKCEKNKIVLGKERCIYKVYGSKKHYLKHKGKLMAVTDFIKHMKHKN